MALKRWHRVGLTAAGMALAVVLALPSRPLPVGVESGWPVRALFEGWGSFAPNFVDPANPHQRSVNGALFDLRLRVRLARLADSLLTLAPGPRALRAPDHSLIVLYSPSLGLAEARRWLDMLQRELALAPRGTGPGMPVIVALHLVGNPKPGTFSQREWRSVRFVSPRPERPACLVDVRLRERDLDLRAAYRSDLVTGDDVPRTRLLGRCLLFARFGEPGPQVVRWLGGRVDASYYWNPSTNLARALELQRRGTLKLELAGYTMTERLAGACSAHDGPCLRLVDLIGDPWNRWEPYSLGVWKLSLLASLINQNPTAFERFWQSPLPPMPALEQAYGEPVGTLVAHHQRAMLLHPVAHGPRSSAGTLLSSLGWIVVAVGFGAFAVSRQQVR